jgi:hypothetical protein
VTIFAVGSLHGSPGATTLTMGLGAAWPQIESRQRLVVEADPDGGVLAARYQDLRADQTVADAIVAVRRQFDLSRLLRCTRSVDDLPVLPAPPSADQTHSALVAGADRLAAGLAVADSVDTLVDVGRLTARSPALPLAHRAVVTLLVARTRFEDVALLSARVVELRAAGVEPWLVCVGGRPYDPSRVAAAAELPLFAVVPMDARAATLLQVGGGNERRLRRSLLWRTLTDMASDLLGFVSPGLLDQPAVSDPSEQATPAAASPPDRVGSTAVASDMSPLGGALRVRSAGNATTSVSTPMDADRGAS